MTRALRLAELVLLVTLGGWLIASALLVQLEGYDGLDAILNARFYTGQWPLYTETRAPLLGALLVPGELVARALSLHALDTRPHHAVMALLHAGYLGTAYWFLCRVNGRSWSTLLAFVAAVPCFVFFSYAPFISHDIAPGALLLMMLVVAERFSRATTARDLLLLIALGGVAVLIKPMFVVFWFAVIAAEAVCARWDGEERAATVFRLGLLSAAAVMSFVLLIAASSAVTATVFPDVPFALRGLRHLQFLVFDANQKVLPEPTWVYARNAAAYGPLAIALLVPGLAWSVRGAPLVRRCAVALLIAVGFVHVLRFGSVRYLAFTGPLIACVIAPVIARFLHVRAFAAIAGALLLSGFLPIWRYDIAKEAARIGRPFYRMHPARAFLEHALDAQGKLRRPVYIDWNVLSFASERDTPFAGDLYHDIFHFGRHHLLAFYALLPGDLQVFAHGGKGPKHWPDSAVAITCSTGNLINSPTWERAPALRRDHLVQRVLWPEQSELRIQPDGGFVLQGLGKVNLRTFTIDSEPALSMTGPGARALQAVTFPRASLPPYVEPKRVQLSPQGDAWVEGMLAEQAEQARPPLQLRFFRERYALRASDRSP